MPTRRVPMRRIKDILRLKYAAGLSHEKIARACGVSKGVVAKYVRLAQAAGLSWPLPEDLDDSALQQRLFPTPVKVGRYAEPDYPALHQELKRKGVTLQLLWEEYAEAHGERAYRYSQFCERYRQWRARQCRSLRQRHRAGDKLFIDYCGPTVPIVDPDTGEVREAHIFVAVLGASNYTYAEATRSEGLEDFIAAHQRAFRFFGGVPALLVPDNTKSAITKACRYDPVANQTYADMARHYDTAVLPARPNKPRDKAKVEAGVLLVERWILARLRHHTFFSLAELNRTIAELLVVLNQRPFQKLPGSRLSAFEELEREALRPLPPTSYEFARWKKARPGIDYHVEVEHNFYSVPHTLVGHTLEVCITASTVEVLHRGKRVAVHAHLHGKGRFVTEPAHLPKAHRAHLEWSPGRFMNWAAEIGPATRDLVKYQLHNRPHPEHGYRACLGLLSLARRYGKARLEVACTRALAIASPTYASVNSILKQGLDQLALELTHDDTEPLPEHANVRGPDYYH
ncbi:MAG: IS21 family transposase [Gammaproteobacteria bacterium]|nr:IS21 family transposase [Gammaproteobacteria bacterium]